MDKKELKFYETPVSDVVELELNSILCSSPEEPGEDEGQGDNPWH